MSCQPPPMFTPMSTPLIVVMSHPLRVWLFQPSQLLQGGQLLLDRIDELPHLCFVCIIKETRSKLMKRYWTKLLKRKLGTMSNLRLLIVAPHCWTLPRLITVIYIFPSCCPRQKSFRTSHRTMLENATGEFLLHWNSDRQSHAISIKKKHLKWCERSLEIMRFFIQHILIMCIIVLMNNITGLTWISN